MKTISQLERSGPRTSATFDACFCSIPTSFFWWFGNSRRLSTRAAREIARSGRVLVSPASCWELAFLVKSGRVALDRGVFQWVEDLLADERVDLALLTHSAAVDAGLLGEEIGGDPADRFLYATARELSVPFVTKDYAIRSFARAAGDVRTIW